MVYEGLYSILFHNLQQKVNVSMSAKLARKQRSRALKRIRRGNAPGSGLMSLNSRPVIYSLTATGSGASVTNATSAGYSWLTIDSSLYSAASNWSQLAATYNFVRPVGVRITVAYCRATSSTDNPRIGFAQTPDGTPVGTTSMNISTFESSLCKAYNCGPGEEVVGYMPAKVQLAVYAPVSNGYMSVTPNRLNINSLPRIYYGDLLFFTPGVVLTSTANYVSWKLEFIMEFSVLDPQNIA